MGEHDPGDLAAWSFGFMADPPPGAGDTARPLRALRDVRLVSWSLDLWPNPFQVAYAAARGNPGPFRVAGAGDA